MSSFIDNYCGRWKDPEGNQLDISRIDNKHLSVTFTRSGEDKPLKRPWFKNRQAAGMIGIYDQETGSSIDVVLSDEGVGFYLNLCFDFTANNYDTISPSIIRNEKDIHLKKFYHFLGPLQSFNRCTQ